MLVPIIAAVYRRLPIKSGVTRLSFNPVMNRLMDDCHDPMVAKMKDGNRIAVDPSDYHGRVLYLFGTNDIKVSMNAQAFLRKGDVFLDIGANYSTIGLAASSTVGPTGAVHLFEPQTRIADRVDAAIRAGGYDNPRAPRSHRPPEHRPARARSDPASLHARTLSPHRPDLQRHPRHPGRPSLRQRCTEARGPLRNRHPRP